MNKKTLVLLLAVLTVVCALFAACDVGHQHDFETTWSYNETEHWHKCKGCDEVADKAAHHGGTATCDAKAVCEDCGQPYGQLADHDWGEWTQTKAPTCTEVGTETRTCKTNPQHTETRDVAKINHDIGETWQHDETKHWKECNVCHTHDSEADHDFGEWSEVTAATYTAAGSKERVCNTCQYKQTDIVPQLVAVSSITVGDSDTLTLTVGETATLVATVLPENATDKTVVWASSNTEVAEVARGMLVARSAGTATITVTANDGQGTQAQITVNVVVLADSVSLEGAEHVAIGGTITLKATIAPENATDKAITWSVDNADVATIDNGVLTGVSEGKVVVTATTSNGKTATHTVYVTKVAIDGTEDEAYNQVDKFVASGHQIIGVSHSILLGDKGLYLYSHITDAFVGNNSHVEFVFTFGDEVADGKTFQIRLYKNGSVRAFQYDSTIINSNPNWKWKEDKGTLGMLSNIYFATTAADDGYVLEMFADYSVFGLTEKPQYVNLVPSVWAYKSAGSTSGMISTGLEELKEVDILSTAKALKFDQYGYAAKMTAPDEEIVADARAIVEGNFVFNVTFNATVSKLQTMKGLTFQADGLQSEWVKELGNGEYEFTIPADQQPNFDGKVISVVNGKHGVCGTFVLTLSNDLPVQSIGIVCANPNLIVDETLSLGIEYNPTTANKYTEITWTSDNEAVATVDTNGVVTAHALGTATITATSANGKTATVKILVAEAKLDGNLDDDFYGNTIVWNNDTLKYGDKTATNVVKNATRVYFGEKGLYLLHDVTDGILGAQSRIEDFICTGDKAVAQSDTQKANLYYFRFYLHEENGKLFKTYYNGKDSSGSNFPWTEDKNLEIYYVVKQTDKGYVVESYIPYATLGLTEKPQYINLLSENLLHPTAGAAVKNAFGNNYGYQQNNTYVISNYVKFDSMGYYRCNNTDYKTIEISDVILGSTDVVGGNYLKDITIESMFQLFDSFTVIDGLTFDCEYITAAGNGVYNIVIPEGKQPDFADGVTVKILRGTEEIGTFMIKLTKNIPVTEVTIEGADMAYVGDEGLKLTATVKPDNATNKTVTWTSSDNDVASIDDEGNITIYKEGTVTFTATADGIQRTHALLIIKKAVVKVDYTDGKVVNSGSGSDVVVDTVIIENNEFTHTDANTFNKGVDGDQNGALATNNQSGSYLLVKDYALGTGDFTISMWVYVEDFKTLSQGAGSVLFATNKVDLDPMAGLVMGIRRNNKDASSATAGRVSYKTVGNTSNQVISKDINLNGWHKYTMVRKGATLSIYIDDVLLQSKDAIAADWDYGTCTICFGAYTNEAWKYNDKVLVYDNVTIYDCALSQNQIAALTALKK